nr:replication protein A 70 kDa DNA-binding subunit B [Tanacetum cinerariifolium]
MATFVSGYISDLSPVKDNIQLRVRILCAWLQPLYNNQQVKNMKMIVMDKHGVQCVIVGTMIAIQEDEGWWYLGCRACRGKDETKTMSLSLFNDEVQAMVGRSAYQLCEKYAKSESDGSIPTEITNLIGNKYAFKVATDDYNVKKLLPFCIVLRFLNDQEIINSVLACATPIKDLESQTNKNTTPNEKQKTNKCPAEGEPGNTTMDENDPANARKRRKELMSNRKRAAAKDKRSNPSVSSDAFLIDNPLNGNLPPLSLSNKPLTQIYNISAFGITHGQLYVALSRVKSKRGLKVVVCDEECNVSKTTTNVIYKEVLHGL